MLHFLLSFLDARKSATGEISLLTICTLLFCGAQEFRNQLLKKSLVTRFASLMPAKVRAPIAKPFMYLGGLNSIVTSLKIQNLGKNFKNHNWALVTGISGFL
jgi:hypothetical protein